MGSGSQVPLEYAPRTRRVRRRVVSLVIAVVVAGVSFWQWQRHKQLVIERATFLWHRHECESYAQPPDFVAYEEEPQAAGKLIALRKGYAPIEANMEFTWPPVFVPVGFDPKPPPDILGSGDFIPSVVFLHRRTAPGGPRYLVFVDLMLPDVKQDPQNFAIKERVLAITVRARLAGGIFSGGGSDGGISVFFTTYFTHLRGSDRLRIFFGQPSDEDSSKFTIRYELNGESGVIEGWVDGTPKVQLRVVSGKLSFGHRAN